MPAKRDPPSNEDLKSYLCLKNTPDSDEELKTLLNIDYGVELPPQQKIFVLLYTNPISKYCGLKYKAAIKSGYTRQWADFALSNLQNVIAAVEKAQSDTRKSDLKKVLNKIVERETNIYLADRTELFEKGSWYDKDGNEHDYKKLKDFSKLTDKQKQLISNITKDKFGNDVVELEKRSDAKNTLLNLLRAAETPQEEKKTVSTEITIEGIRDKVQAKIKVIQNNESEAAAAGEFIDYQSENDEEA